jgi:dTDP-4-dehydrorhamnose reductase
MKALILGSNGLLGQAITAQLAMQTIAPSHAELDLCNFAAISQALTLHRPQVVINCAAYSAVDAAEVEPHRAAALNHHAVAHLVQACDATGASLVHFSTDFVFDGLQGGAPALRPYTEADPTGPLNVYGRTKLAGEQAVLASAGAHYVLRVSWLYGDHGHNFFSQLPLWLQRDRVLRIVDDQLSVPNQVTDIAAVLAQWCRLWLGLTPTQAVQFLSLHKGLYHLVGSQVMSRYAYAQQIAAQLGKQAVAQLEPVPAATFTAPARRPLYSAMSGAKFMKTFGIDWPARRGSNPRPTA